MSDSTLKIPSPAATASKKYEAGLAADQPILFGEPINTNTVPLSIPSASLASKDLMVNQFPKEEVEVEIDDEDITDKNIGTFERKGQKFAGTEMPSTKESEFQSEHIMTVKKHDQAARLAADIGAEHLRGVPVSQAIDEVEHKCDQSCETECKFAASKFITEADVLAIRKHDQVAAEAAGAGAKLSKGGYLSKAVHVKEAIGAINEKGLGGPTMMQSIGSTAKDVTSAIGGAVTSAKESIVSAKESIVQSVSKTGSDTSLEGSITSTTTTSGAPTKIQRVVGAATTVKDTLVDAGYRAAPVLQKAATVAGQVARTAAHFAQPIVHGVAVALAEATQSTPQPPQTETSSSTVTNTTNTGEEASPDAENYTNNTTTTSQDSVESSSLLPEKNLSSKELPTSSTSSPNIEEKDKVSFTPDSSASKDKQERLPSLHSSMTTASPSPMFAGDFRKSPATTTEEVKSRPSSPHLLPMSSPSPAPSSTLSNMSTNPVTATASTTAPAGSVPTVMLVLPDAALNQGSNKDFDGTQKGLVPSRSNDDLPTTNYQIDIQVKQKANLNTNANLQQSTELR